ncbi:MAG: hypothetical protein HOK54_17815 [Alphaproteobacteria bacterium]|nr:hypothetical protein [Alphaproteobacteria bacterium]
MSEFSDLPRDCHPTIRGVAEYWMSIHPSPDVLPGRVDFDPIELPADVWPFLVLSEVLSQTPFDVRYKVVGTEVVNLDGYDATGMKLSECPVIRDREEIISDYRVAIDCGRMSFRRVIFFDIRRGFEMTIERGHFPLAANGNDVDMILTTIVKLERKNSERNEALLPRLCG